MAGQLPQSIERKLDGFRRSVRLWVMIDGVSLLCAVLVGLSFLSLLVDRFMRMDRAQRAVSLVLGLGALSVLAYRRLLRPLGRELGEDSLCERVEAHHRELKQGLFAAVQFSRMAELSNTGYSPALVKASIAEGVRAAEGVDFNDVLDAKRRNKSLLTGAGLLALLAAAFVLFPSTMSLWFSRNVLMSNSTWPQETYLTIKGVRDGALAVPRGDDLELRVEADEGHVIPTLVYVDYEMEDGSASGTEQLVMIGGNAFRWTLKNVQKPLQLRVRGGDAETEYIDVKLVARPTVDKLILTLTPPAYTGQQPRILPTGEGSYYVLKGSRIDLEATANKPLESARLLLKKDEIATLSPKGSKTFKASLEIKKAGRAAYRIHLKDTDGLESRRPTRFSVKAGADRKPSVRAKLAGIGEIITAKASVPIQFKISDDFALTEAGLSCQHSGGDPSETQKPEPIRFDFAEIPELKKKFGRREMENEYRLEVEPLGLKIGSHLSFQLEAKDNDSLNGPNLGVSGNFSLKIVTEEELRNELLRREQEQRQEFERLMKDQQELLAGARTLLTTLQNADRIPEKEWRLLKKYEKRQRLTGGRCLSIAEVENNKLEESGGKIRRRLKNGIIQPLQRLANQKVPRAANLLDQAGTASKDKLGRTTALNGAAAQQEQILKEMKKILRNMVKWEGYQEAVNLLRDILKSQKNVNEQTLKEQQKRILNIFDEEEDKDSKNKTKKK